VFDKKYKSVGIRKSEMRTIISECLELAEQKISEKVIKIADYEKIASLVSDIYREISLDIDDDLYYKRIMTNFVLQKMKIKTKDQERFQSVFVGCYALISCNLAGKMTIASFVIKKPSSSDIIAEYESSRKLSDGSTHLVRGYVFQDDSEIYAIGNLEGTGRLRLSVLRPFNAESDQIDLMGMRLAKSRLEHAPGAFPIYCRRVKDPVALKLTGVATETAVAATLETLGHPNASEVLDRLWQIVRLSDESEADWVRRSAGVRPTPPPWSRGVKLNLPE
jgi:hypothetical protein